MLKMGDSPQRGSIEWHKTFKFDRDSAFLFKMFSTLIPSKGTHLTIEAKHNIIGEI